MTRTLAFLLVSLFALPLLAADEADLAVSIDADSRQARFTAEYGVHVRWNATSPPQTVVLDVELPDAPVTQTYLWDSFMDCTTTANHIRCALGMHQNYDAGMFLQLQPATPGTYTLKATVTSSTADPHPENNVATASVEVAGLPWLTPSLSTEAFAQNGIDPGRPSVLYAGVSNSGEYATDVSLRLTLPDGGTFLGLAAPSDTAACTTNDTEIICHWPVVGTGYPTQVAVRYVAPDRDDGGTFRVQAEVLATQPDFSPATRVETIAVPLRRRFIVDSPNEDGRGSLRQAIFDASIHCDTEPCLIAIRGGFVYRPLLPLPGLKGMVKIDGGDERAEIDGSFAGPGDAFAGDLCELRVTNMIIRNFRGHAIEARRAQTCEEGRLLGFYLTNDELTNNERGFVMKGGTARIDHNVIRDNRRAGIFIDGARDVVIADNTISHNAASGIFVNMGGTSMPYYSLNFARIINNVIRDNFEWGICRTRGGVVQVANNEIGGNRYYAYDVDLDFDTPNRTDDTVGLPNKPVLLSASYDSALGKTVVRLRNESSYPYASPRLDLYASDGLSSAGYPQAEHAVATTNAAPGESLALIDGDYRGKWITATFTREYPIDLGFSIYDTSEISNAVPVD